MIFDWLLIGVYTSWAFYRATSHLLFQGIYATIYGNHRRIRASFEDHASVWERPSFRSNETELIFQLSHTSGTVHPAGAGFDNRVYRISGLGIYDS